MQELKLIALDQEDLAVLSAHLQDAVLRVGDMAYLKREKRFAAIANRFDWEAASSPAGSKRAFARRRAGLRFERVLDAKLAGIDLSDKDRVLSLLAISFETGAEPEGHVTLTFSGGAAIRLHVECIEAQLGDLGAAWRTERKPEHADDEAGNDL
jgi:hypothetical protein